MRKKRETERWIYGGKVVGLEIASIEERTGEKNVSNLINIASHTQAKSVIRMLSQD